MKIDPNSAQWSSLFSQPLHALLKSFNDSIKFDHHLAVYDIQGSLAHVSALQKAGILSEDEYNALKIELSRLLDDAKAGTLAWTLQDEDIHSAVERLLTEKLGDLGKKLHTGRSRNDQVAVDMRLYIRDQITQICQLIKKLQKSLLTKAQDNMDTLLPGYTHLQRAQPVRFAHHLLSYCWMLDRDCSRFEDALRRVDVCPLGSGALAGTTFALDRSSVAHELGFHEISMNSMDAVSDRDYIVETLSNASLTMVHLSRLSEELILWCSSEFGYVTLSDAFSTGSSMMPQKKNPDVPELIRGKTGRVFGSLVGMLTIMKGLPMAYNKDFQEDKEGTFDAINTLKTCLEIMAPLIDTMTVNQDAMTNALTHSFVTATELADYLVSKGMPFREAHHVTSAIVKACIGKSCWLSELPLAEMKTFSSKIEEDVYGYLTSEAAVENRKSMGGSSRLSVDLQLNYFRNKVS